MKFEQAVIECIRSCIERYDADITRNTGLITDLHADSFTIIMIVNAVEESYGVAIEPSDLAGCDTVGMVVDRLCERYPALVSKAEGV